MADDKLPVPSRSTAPRPLGGIGDLADLLGGDSDRSRRFLGGIASGALLGAAAAGAALVQRRRREGPRKD